MSGYESGIKNEIKQKFIYEGKSANELSFEYGGKPATSVILKWASVKDKQGLNWFDKRDIYENEKYERTSPKKIASKIFEKMELILNTDTAEFTVNDSKALAELQRSLDKITDRKYHLNMVYQVLTDLLKFLKTGYPGLVNLKLIDAVRHFKNICKKEFEGER